MYRQHIADLARHAHTGSLSPRRCGSAALTLLALLLAATNPAGADSAGAIAQVKPIATPFPKACKDAKLGMSGLCLLGGTSAKTGFLVRGADGKGAVHPVVPNRFIGLSPGEYLLYSASGIDQGHEVRFAVQQGLATNLPIAALKFGPASGKAYRFQHFQPMNGVAGKGCAAEHVNRGVRAVLPGTYQIRMVPKHAANQPGCSVGGTTINVMAGKTLAARARTLRDQVLPPGNGYVHPNRVSALASVGPYRHPITRIGLLPGWKSHRGVSNPDQTAHATLVFSGVGSVQFMVPMKFTQRRRDCGVSLAEAGLPAHGLMTDCRFRGQRLTAFRINSGSYYTVNNRHGMTAIEGNYLNNPILVQDVNFKFK